MELQIPYCVCSEVQKESFLWGKTAGDRRNTADFVQLEEDKNHRSRSVPGTCAHVSGDSAESGSIELHGVPERENKPLRFRQRAYLFVQYNEKAI